MPNLTTTALCIYMAGPMHVHNVSDVSACSQQMFAGKIEDYHRDMEIRPSNCNSALHPQLATFFP